MPASGTPALGALAGLGVIWAISGCFNPIYANCRITCDTENECPAGLTCATRNEPPLRPNGRRPVPIATTPAPIPARWMRAATTAPTRWTEVMAATEATRKPPVPRRSSATTESASPSPRRSARTWSSCSGRRTSRQSVHRSTSGATSRATATTRTRSFRPLFPTSSPTASSWTRISWAAALSIVNSPSLDFGSGDFAIIVVAGLASSTTPVTFFQKSDGARLNGRRITIDWVLSSAIAGRPHGALNDTPLLTDSDLPQPSVGAYALRRATDRVELRLNEAVLGSADLPTPGLSTTNSNDVYLGVSGFNGRPADSLAAVIAIRSAIAPTDLKELQSFLRINFGSSP